jgi:hypothetical protein
VKLTSANSINVIDLLEPDQILVTENALKHISCYKNYDKLKLTNYNECEEIPDPALTWLVSISGGISKFWCSPDEVLKVKRESAIFETWEFEAKK